MHLQEIFAGLSVGILVGLTGVGGGSLMTPILVFLFGHAPATAVGTDLLFACTTKLAGTAVHGHRDTVDWRVVRLLALGSLPAAAISLLVLWRLGASQSRNGLILGLLGTMLVVTGLASLGVLRRRGKGALADVAAAETAEPERPDPGVTWPALTVAAGAVLGTLVTVTSIGAGAVGVVILRTLYPRTLPPVRLVGTDLAYAIPLTLVAGAGHLAMGNIDFALLGWLLAGSIPGIVAGSLLGARVHASFLRRLIGTVLVLVGARTLWGVLA